MSVEYLSSNSKRKNESFDYRTEISEESAKQAILSETPLKVEHIELAGEGMGSTVFRVNDEYMFKFSKYEKASKSIEQEKILLPLIPEYVHTEIPHVEFNGARGKEKLNFIGYKGIKGEGLTKEILDSLSEKEKSETIQSIAEFVNDMHTVDTYRAKECGVEEVQEKDFFESELNETEKLVFPLLEKEISQEAEKLENSITDSFREYLGNAENFEFVPKVIHGDLERDQAILFDNKKKKLAGVVDFGSVRIGDPDYDLWRLYSHYGKDFMDEFLPNYQHSTKDEDLFKKLEFFWDAQVVHRLIRFISADDKENINWGIEKLKERMRERKYEKTQK